MLLNWFASIAWAWSICLSAIYVPPSIPFRRSIATFFFRTADLLGSSKAFLFFALTSLMTIISSPSYEEELAEVVGLVEEDWVERGLVEVGWLEAGWLETGWLEAGWVGIDGVESGMVISDVVVASDSFVACRSLVLLCGCT